MLLISIGVFIISSGVLCAPSDAAEVGRCDGGGCAALQSGIIAAEKARKELGCCTHADCSPGVTTILCAHDVMTRFFQNLSTSKICPDFKEQCEALRVAEMNLQLSSNILGCHEREERAFISAPSASTRKVLEDLLPQAVVAAIHNALPASLQLAKVDHAVRTASAAATGIALAGGHSDHKGNVYLFDPPPSVGLPFTTGLGWGAVCADGFTEIDADTVCKQLGFAGAKAHYGLTWNTGAVVGNTFGPVPAPYAFLIGGVSAIFPAPPTGPQCVANSVNLLGCAGMAAAYAAAPNCPSGVAGVECEDHPHH